MREADEHADTPSRSTIVKVHNLGKGFDHYRVSCTCDAFPSLGNNVFSTGLFIENTICLACQQQARVEKIDE